MRLIDADALLTERKKSKYYHLPNGDIAIPIIDVEHAPTVKPKPHWIPCSERLPEKNCRCLTTNEACGSFEVDWNAWINGGWLYPNEKPIAWMPFPDSYEGGDSE